ncbi:MAG: ASCH domain-containing protein [Patescibacteria group bacterium]|nr:ASCH domain-containing protein [Patescibacteria group bacterium]
MRKIILRFHAVDKANFKKIKDGLKTVETRAATTRYQNIKKGDVLVIVCGKERIIKKVKCVRHFKNIKSMTKAISFKKIMPSVKSIIEMRKIYSGYPGYKEKIKRFGLIALEI